MDINHTQSNHHDGGNAKPSIVVWRSGLLSSEQMKHLDQDVVIKLQGFVSGTQKKELAEYHALNQRRQSVDNLVLFKIGLNAKHEYFRLDREDFSPYFNTEKEVVLCDGIQLQITQIQTKFYDKQYLKKVKFNGGNRFSSDPNQDVVLKIVHLQQ